MSAQAQQHPAQEAVRPEAQQRWRLRLFQPSRPGELSLCEHAHRRQDFQRLAFPETAEPLQARWLDEAASLRWQGGRVSQPGAGAEPAGGRRLRDGCFTLFVDGAALVSGAVVQSYSARRFDHPALVVEHKAAETPLELTLAPSFPVQPHPPPPISWGAPLTALVDGP
ncbi:hypothetical protein [Roseateles violae]|uniref:Uncharacterized protein n=1 Tax=Roseateles violae TaxID=3058042 RepID=A0ABT8DP87_9BURK|nr:hypothetical protein [Pelomonas sp. PFR6]MDN3919972.1 hypothetical protein [Pelomonas sp. PFR6]